MCCIEGKEGIVGLLLESAGIEIDVAHNLTGYTALCYAVNCSSVTIVKRLLDKGAKVDCYTKDGLSPLLLAVKSKSLIILKMLFERFSLDKHSIIATSLLASAAESRGCSHIVRFLIEKGADVIKDSNGDNFSALHYAVENGDEELVDLLLKAGAKIAINRVVKHPEENQFFQRCIWR